MKRGIDASPLALILMMILDVLIAFFLSTNPKEVIS